MRRLVKALLSRAFPIALGIRKVWRLLVRPVTLGVRALVVDDGRVLLVRTHGSRHWSMPGGGVKRGESLRTAAVREALEETGCRVEAERLLGIYKSVHEGMTNHVAVFVCRALNPPQVALNLEIAEARFWPLDALPVAVAAGLHLRLAEHAAGAQGVDGPW